MARNLSVELKRNGKEIISVWGKFYFLETVFEGHCFVGDFLYCHTRCSSLVQLIGICQYSVKSFKKKTSVPDDTTSRDNLGYK